MKNTELRRIDIPLGATIRVTRRDGAHAIYVFRGSDSHGGFYEDDAGKRHGDVGEYTELVIKTADGWTAI